MKLHGRQLCSRFRVRCELPRPDGESLSLVLQPLPLGFQRTLAERGITPPIPPVRVARDSHGRPLRDEAGHALTQTDEHDPAYQQALQQYHERLAVLTVAAALAGDENVEFETAPPAPPATWHDYADALYREFQQAGFMAGDLAHLCEYVSRISNLAGDHLRASLANFSPAVAADTG